MSSKLQLLLRQMLMNTDYMEDIFESSGEFYFKYKSRQFSIQRRSEGTKFIFFVYPQWNGESAELADLYETGTAQQVKVVSYGEAELEDPSVLELLFSAVKEKDLGLDDLFDEIIE